MLNYIWLGLLIIGITCALYFDISDEFNDTYHNNTTINAVLYLQTDSASNVKQGKIAVSITALEKAYNSDENKDVNLPCDVVYENGNPKIIKVQSIEDAPQVWKKIQKASQEDILTLNIKSLKKKNVSEYDVIISTPEISFVKMKDVTNNAIEYSKISVNIAIGLIGIMALWLGVMKVGEEAGIITTLAKAVKPITKFLFPEVPADHPAIGAIIMNMAANMLGLGNAATPFGLKAMEELDTLNKNKGTATNAMCTFLAVNTAGLTLIPATAIAVRAAAGSSNPAVIIGTSIFGATCATITGIISAKILEKFTSGKGLVSLINKMNYWKVLKIIIVLTLIILTAVFIISYLGNSESPDFANNVKKIISTFSIFAIPFVIFIFIGYGALKKVKVYETFVEGAKEGFNIAVKIIPYLVAMLVAIGIFRGGGGMELLTTILSPVTNFIGMPAEAMPMALMRPLSGSGSLGIMTDIISQYGPDSYIGILVSTFFGSTETTFYVIAVYFGAVNIRRTRHALAAGILADIAGILGALFIVNLLFG